MATWPFLCFTWHHCFLRNYTLYSFCKKEKLCCSWTGNWRVIQCSFNPLLQVLWFLGSLDNSDKRLSGILMLSTYWTSYKQAYALIWIIMLYIMKKKKLKIEIEIHVIIIYYKCLLSALQPTRKVPVFSLHQVMSLL